MDINDLKVLTKAGKTMLYFLIISISLFLIIEIFQRGRYAYRTKQTDYLYYGFNNNLGKIINVQNRHDSFFRWPFSIFEKGKGINLLFMGTSSTYGIFNDDYHTFPYLLQSKMPGVSCLNAGRLGISSEGYMDILRKCFDKFCLPDTVIFYAGGNDMFLKSYFDQRKGGLLNNKLFGRLEKYSLLLLSIKEKIIIQDQVRKRKDYNYRARFIIEFKKNMEECIKFLQDKEIEVVLIPEVIAAEQFSASSLNDYRWYQEIYSEIPEVIKYLAKKHNCRFLDPKNILCNNWKENFVDPQHLTDRGNEIFSEFLLHNLHLR